MPELSHPLAKALKRLKNLLPWDSLNCKAADAGMLNAKPFGFEGGAIMKTRKFLMVSTALATLTFATSAAEGASTYASIFGGVSFMPKQNIKGTSFTRTTTTIAYRSKESIDTSFKTGYVIGGNFGIDWGDFRTELEVAYRENRSGKRGHLTTHLSIAYQTSHHKPGTFYTIATRDSAVPTDIRLRAYSLMANAWYDFHDLDLPAGITPYVGGGIGVAQVGIDGSINSKKILQKDDVVFAWQLGAGASLPIAEQTSLFFDYRYFAADSAGLFLEPGYHGGHVKANFDNHSVLIGVRFNFS